MIRMFGVDENNDLFIGSDGNLSVITGLQAVLQLCEHCAKTILAEMVFNQPGGMPYFETVWIGGPTTAPFEAAFRERISAIPDVTGIEDLLTEQVGDTMVYTATISTIYGTGVINA